MYFLLIGFSETVLCKQKSLMNNENCNVVKLFNFHKDHKSLDNIVYIDSKVYQLLLYYTSFTTRGQNCVQENWP